MMEVKDQAIRLFGKKIALPEELNLPFFSGDCVGAEKDDDCSDEHSGNGRNSKASTESDENSPKTPSIGEVSNQIDNGKTLKKPDKILPCPRCSSMDTKFCYYNNYNVNQPRHFCKSCQRYWTAGGTMRNVPVGAGRRKNKTSASVFNHVSISNPLPNAPPIETNAAVLSFSSDRPLNGAQSINNCSGGVPCVPWAIPYIPAPYWSYNMNLYSSNLGKHSREGELIKGSSVERKIPGSSIVVPKTLRIDDLDEAAKSSIWETLGIKNDCINRGGLFKSFEKGDDKSHSKTVTSPAFQANPAAMSRSLNFQERA